MAKHGTADTTVLAELMSIPNVGPRTASDLVRLGVRGLAQLRDADPDELYERLCRLDAARHDVCCLDVFRAAVDFVNGSDPRPWWEYSRERKSGLRPTKRPS